MQQGKPEELSTQPRNEYAAKLIGLTNILLGKDLQPFISFEINIEKKYWVPFIEIKINNTNNISPNKIDFLGDEFIAHVSLEQSSLQVKSFTKFPKEFGIEITNAIPLEEN